MRKCAIDSRPVDTIHGIGPQRMQRLWNSGIRNLGELYNAIDDSIEFGIKLPAGITKPIADRVMGFDVGTSVKPGDTLGPETPAIKAAEGAFGFNNVLIFIGSTVQGRVMLRSPSAQLRAAFSRLAMLDLKTTEAYEGGKPPKSVEHKMKVRHGQLSDAFRKIENLRKQYVMGNRLEEGKTPSTGQMLKNRLIGEGPSARRELQMGKDQWYVAITDTLRNGGDARLGPADAKNHLEAAAKIIREDIWAPDAEVLGDLGKRVGDDPLAYVMRIYDVDVIRMKKNEFKADMLQNLVHKFTMLHKQPPKAFMVTKMREQVDAWTEGILAAPHQRNQLNLAEMEENIEINAAGEWEPVKQVSNIGRPAGTRKVDVDEDVLAPYLRNDIREIMSKYMNTRMIDLEISKEFGDVQLSQVREAIDLEYAELIAQAKFTAKRTLGQAAKRIPITVDQLLKQKQSDMDDLDGTLNIMRGMYDVPADPYTVLGRTERMARIMKDINYIRLGGGFAITALGDIGGAMLVNGIRNTMKDMHGVMRHGIEAEFKRGPISQAEMESIHLDWLDVMNLRGVSLFATGEYGGQGYTAIERATHLGSRRMAELSLLSNWTNFAKQVAARGVTRRMIDVAERAELGKASKDELAIFTQAGLNPHKLQQMLDLQRLHGGKSADGRTKWLGLEKWNDQRVPAGLRDDIRDVLITEVDRAILTPGATDAPLMMHSLGGTLLFQFRRFGMSHTQKLLVPAMQSAKAGDLQILNALAVSSAMGSIVYTLKELVGNREMPTDLNRIIQEGVVRSDMWGKLGEVDGFISATTGGVVGIREFFGPSTSLANTGPSGYLEGLAQQLSPATYSTLVEGGRMMVGLENFMEKGLGNMSEEQIRSWRRMSPYNTLFYLDWWFDMMENGVQAAGRRHARRLAIESNLR